jgi:hypothetical protein
VCRLRVLTDMMEVSRQLGLMPPQGSQLEKAAAAAQRLGVMVRDRPRRGGQAAGA